jgi:hypothetical protein
MKIKLAALTLLCVAMICSESNADLLGRMLGKSGCGEAAPAADACCERGINISIHIGLPGRLFNGCKPECEEQSDDCCGMNLDLRGKLSGLVSRIDSIGNNFFCCEEAPAEEPAEEPADDCCGMNLDLRGKLSGLVSRLGSIGNSCGCEEAPAEEPADDCCGMNLDLRGKVSGLVSRLGSIGNSCGCEEAPAEEPADDCCGMNLDLRGKVSGLLSRIDSIGNNFFCCEEAPADDCDNGRIAVVRTIVARMPRPAQNLGCDETPDCDDPCKLNLLDRIRQIGNRCNDACETEEAATEDQANNGTSVDSSLFMSFRG